MCLINKKIKVSLINNNKNELYSLRGNRLIDFSRNLGRNSNNIVEACVIYQGILLAQEQQLKHITIIGDSKNIICYFVMGTTPKNTKLQRIIDRTKALMSTTQANFFHTMRGNNREVDKMAN